MNEQKWINNEEKKQYNAINDLISPIHALSTSFNHCNFVLFVRSFFFVAFQFCFGYVLFNYYQS